MKASARREEMFEQRFVHEQTLDFRIEARRNKALCEWATGLMGKTDRAAEAYRDAMIALALKTGRDSAIVERISLDLAMEGIAVSQDQVYAQLNLFWAQAKKDPA